MPPFHGIHRKECFISINEGFAEVSEYQRANNLFFDETTNGQLLRFREKLRMKKEKYTALEQQIRSEVEAISVKTLKDGNVILT